MVTQHPNPSGSAAVVRIEGVPRGYGIVVVFAGPIVGLLTHWASGRSQACPGAGKCPPNFHRSRTVWKGYAPVRRWQPVQAAWCAAVLEVTEALEEQLRGRELCGEMWHLMRSLNGKKSGAVGGIFYSRRTEAALLKNFDVVAPIQRLYHTLDLEFGAVNALPAKILEVPVTCDGPLTEPAAAPREPAKPTTSQRETLRKMAGRMGSPPNGNGHAVLPFTTDERK